MAFQLQLSAELQANIERERREALRLYGLTDRWLAHELMRLCRRARQERSDVRPRSQTYDTVLLWGLIPELARRLGYTRTTQEMTQEIDWEGRDVSNYVLRLRTGHTLVNVSPYAGGQAWRLLTREAVNGNPLVYAVDRLHPGRLDDDHDPLARNIREVARYRGTEYAGVWTPSVLAD